MKQGVWKRGLSLIFLSFIACADQLSATEHFVTVNNSFSPPSLTIDIGDTVTWSNLDDFFTHTVTSNIGAWTEISLDPAGGSGDTASLIFNSGGNYPYFDRIGGSGSITVVAAVAPITMSSPKVVSGQFQFDISGLTVGKTNYILASTNLTTWVSLRTNVATATTTNFTQTQTSSFSRRFYRVQQLP